MGWRIELVSNKLITEEAVNEFVSQLPEKYSFELGNSKQPWGWVTKVDITLQNYCTLNLSGSYGISGEIAEEFSEYAKKYFENKGHRIKLTEFW